METFQYSLCHVLLPTELDKWGRASGYTNYAIAQPEEDLTKSLGSFANLFLATTVDFSVVAMVNENNERLANHLEEQADSIQ